MQTRQFSRRITLPLAWVLMTAAMSSACLAKDNSREAALKSAEAARFAANVSADARALGQLLDDGLEYTHSNGELDSKASFIESLTSGRRDYVSIQHHIESLRIFGDVAVIRGKAEVTVTSNGKPNDLKIGYTDVWLWKDQRWQMTAWRSAPLPDAPK
jgi:hypothetical protein